MQRYDIRNAAAGAFLILFGASYALYAWTHYPVGTLARMEPGMLPTVLGVILAGLGLLILLPALIAPAVRADGPPVELRPFLAIILATAAFALSVGPLGVLPAVFAATVIACLADTRLSVVGALALGGALAILVVLAFRLALGLPLTLARWPFS